MMKTLYAHNLSAREFELCDVPETDSLERRDWTNLSLALVQAERDELRLQLERTNAELARMRERTVLCEGLASIGELVSGVAHELNNPLTTVIGYAQLLQASGTSDEMRADLDIISHEAERCHRIVQNLLNLARQKKVELGPVALDEMIQRTLELKAYGLRADNIRVTLETEATPPVLGNPYRLQQVLLNLVNNAHDAMAQAHGRGMLTIGCRVVTGKATQKVCVSVTDDGPGVPPGVREHIFDPFFTTKQEGKGTGLGLTISRQIVQEMGGQLVLDTTYTGGARFLLELPIDTSGRTRDSDIPRMRATCDSKTRILVVDDEVDLAELTSRVLASLGYQTLHAVSGEEALSQLDDCDLVVLDIKMPGIDGRSVYDHICQGYPHLIGRVLLTTGDVVNTETKGWAEGTGCTVLEKPFTIEQLAAAVEHALIL